MADLGVTDRIARLIAGAGPIPVAQYMAEANRHYYATRDPFGAAGDFVTAPEVSQMFGELVGLWLTDLWLRAGSPEVRYVELGPGRGTLAQDALRAMRSAGLKPELDLVETSPVLREEQSGRLPRASWHGNLAGVPRDKPLLVVANEFFDALPVHQLVATGTGWCERFVAYEEGCFVPVTGPLIGDALVPEHLQHAPPGTILETSPASLSIARELASRLARQGGAALIIDYGHERTSLGETLQAVARHAYASPWEEPGERDLTAHVDFQSLIEAAREEPVRVFGPRTQGGWLKAMGIDTRSAALVLASPHLEHDILAGRDRLTRDDEMGRLFKVVAMVAQGWPPPVAF